MLSWKDKILLTERIGTTKNYFFLKFMHSYFLKVGVFGQALNIWPAPCGLDAKQCAKPSRCKPLCGLSVQNCAIAHGVWHVAITAYFINSVGCLSAPFTPGHLNHAAVTAAKVSPIELMPKCWMLLSNVHTAGCLTRHHGSALPSAALWENVNEWC